MRRARPLPIPVVSRWAACPWSIFALLAALAAPGCGEKTKSDYASVTDPPTVRLIKPPIRTIVRNVGQPSFIQSYERTSIFPKLTAYIEKWKVDIGDKVKKGDLLATLFVPELIENYGTKKATVALEKERIELARKVVDVAEANVKAAVSRVAEARASLTKFQTETDRWDSEVKRLTREVQRGVVGPQILLQSTNRFKSSAALRDAAKATIERAQADLLSRQADSAAAKVDVTVAQDRLAVAESEEKRLEAWVGYLTLLAPFDGVIVARNANTFDFVLPSTGDPTAMQRSPDLSAGRAAPIYVVDRTDIVRIYVDIPEQDANHVHIGTKATVLARAFRDRLLEGTVTRTSWALAVKSRTLRAEIDLPNPDSRILPGMYAYGNVVIERKGVRSLPVEALVQSGNQTFCWQYDDGHATRLELETGLSGQDWIEVTFRRIPTSAAGSTGSSAWTPIDGSEQIILGDLSILTEGGPVTVTDSPPAVNIASAAADNELVPMSRLPAPALRKKDASRTAQAGLGDPASAPLVTPKTRPVPESP
jgi:multidrug efflux pump subunit AcrA (membrane-fusion protein)